MESAIIYDLMSQDILIYKQKSGIYGLIDTETKEIFYVGQSKNLYDRLRRHRTTTPEQIMSKIIKEEGRCNRCKSLAMYDFIQNNPDRIGFTILAQVPPEELEHYEDQLISLLQPKYNYKGVDVPYR